MKPFYLLFILIVGLIPLSCDNPETDSEETTQQEPPDLRPHWEAVYTFDLPTFVRDLSIDPYNQQIALSVQLANSDWQSEGRKNVVSYFSYFVDRYLEQAPIGSLVYLLNQNPQNASKEQIVHYLNTTLSNEIKVQAGLFDKRRNKKYFNLEAGIVTELKYEWVQPDTLRFQFYAPKELDEQGFNYVLNVYRELQFWETYANLDVVPALMQANKQLGEIQMKHPEDFGLKGLPSLLGDDPLNDQLIQLIYDRKTRSLTKDAVIGRVETLLQPKVYEVLNRPAVTKLLPNDARPQLMDVAELGDVYFNLLMLKTPGDSNLIIRAGDVAKTDLHYDNENGCNPCVKMELAESGKQKWQQLATVKEAEFITVIFNGIVEELLTVDSAATTSSIILNNKYEPDDAEDIVNQMNAGDITLISRLQKWEYIVPQP